MSDIKYWTFREGTVDQLRQQLAQHPQAHLRVRIDHEQKMWLQVLPMESKDAAQTLPTELDESFPCPPFCA